jgi:hypothetical protein
MAFKDSLQMMLENLSEQTINGRISWIPISNTKMEIDIEDIKFEFLVNWRLEIDTGWTMSNGWINLKSKDLDFILYSHNFPEQINQIKDYLCKIHFNQHKPSDQKVIDQIDNISKTLSIQEYRDKKISNIFDER